MTGILAYVPQHRTWSGSAHMRIISEGPLRDIRETRSFDATTGATLCTTSAELADQHDESVQITLAAVKMSRLLILLRTRCMDALLLLVGSKDRGLVIRRVNSKPRVHSMGNGTFGYYHCHPTRAFPRCRHHIGDLAHCLHLPTRAWRVLGTSRPDG